MERVEARIGASPKDQFDVHDQNNNRIDPSSAIFPILRQPNPLLGDIGVVGTGFYIAHQGLFVTARHVLEECLDNLGQPTIPLTIVHRFPELQKIVLRPVIKAFLHNGADIAVGIATPMRHDETGNDLWSNCLVLSSRPAQPGDNVITYAYPNATVKRLAVDQHQAHFYPMFYQGAVVECFPDGRDRVMMPGPCFLTSLHLHGGASGGPVFEANSGRVCGINSTSFNGATDVSFVSMVQGLLGLEIDGVVIDDSNEVRKVRLSRLIELGHVFVA